MTLFICNQFCIQAKFYEKPYVKVSADLKKNIKNSFNNLSTKMNFSNEDWSLIETLVKIIEVIDETATIRKSLMQFRKDLEIWKSDENLNEYRSQMIELTIELVNLYLYCTVCCTRLSSIYKRYELLKSNIKEFKETNFKSLNKVDQSYVGFLFKLPKLIIIKRGFLEDLKKLQNENKQEKISNGTVEDEQTKVATNN